MEWQAFLDCFDSAVHSNPKLCNIDKTKSEKAQPCHQIHYLPHHCVVRVESRDSCQGGQKHSAFSLGGRYKFSVT